MLVTKEADIGTKRQKPRAMESATRPVEEGELPERWSARRKCDLVLRLLRGEALDAVSRESQVPAHELESWKRIFLETGARGLKSRAEPEERELTLARTKIGELMMRLELAEYLIEKKASRRNGRGPGDERPRQPRDETAVSPHDDLCGLRDRAVECVCGGGFAGGVAVPGQARAQAEVTDATLLDAIRTVLVGTPFHGEGYRKVRARLAHRGLAVSGKRILRLMRQHHLLAPRRLGPPNGDPAHAGTIITTAPNEMWGTDATRFYTEQGGWCWFFGAIDHYCDDVVGWHVAKLGDRWAALEPLRQGAREILGGFRKDVARGLKIRCDWGPQYIADAWIIEVKWLGMTISPSYVGEPECNGVMEPFIRTLKEQWLYSCGLR